MIGVVGVYLVSGLPPPSTGRALTDLYNDVYSVHAWRPRLRAAAMLVNLPLLPLPRLLCCGGTLHSTSAKKGLPRLPAAVGSMTLAAAGIVG